MKRNKLRGAVLGILDVTMAESAPRNRPAPPGRLIEVIDLGKSVSEMQKDRIWKQTITKMVNEKGYDVLAINVLHQTHQQGFNIAISVVRSKKGLPRNKPVSRGGAPLGPSRMGAKTMAARRRGGAKR